MIKSDLLYQLSYAPGLVRKSLRKRASFSKATRDVQQTGPSFPGLWRAPEGKKPLDSSGFRPCPGWAEIRRVRAARDRLVLPAIPVVAVAVVAAVPATARSSADSRRGAASLPGRRTRGPYGSARRAGASGRRRASCRAGRRLPRSSSWPPPRPPWSRRGPAGARPDPPASAWLESSRGAFIRALARSIRSWRTP